MRLRGLLYKEGINGFGVRGIKPPYARLFHTAGVSHDIKYDEGGSEYNRRYADRLLLLDMVSACETQWQVYVAIFYYKIVRALGWLFFNYKER